jgi:hypothetical protein
MEDYINREPQYTLHTSSIYRAKLIFLRAREALRACLPEPLRDNTFAPLLKGDMVTKRCLSSLLQNLHDTRNE